MTLTIRRLPRTLSLLVALTLTAVTKAPAAINPPPGLLPQAEPQEIWDATTLDPQGQMRELNGAWQYQPWDRLDEMPDFAAAQSIHLPAYSPGAFRTNFEVKSEPGTRRVFLHFGSASFRSRVFVNGKPVGAHAGGFTPFEFDVTEQSRRGTNELTLLVIGRRGAFLSAEPKEPASKTTFNERGQALNSGGDKMAFGTGFFPNEGVRRSVFVREEPLTRIADATITTSYRSRKLTASITLANQATAIGPLDLQLSILPYDIPTKKIGETPVWSARQNVEAKSGLSELQITRPWRNPQLWMPGDPHLYVARLRLLDRKSGEIVNERNVRFGFREVWLNGRKIIFNGQPFRAFAHGTLDTEASPDVYRARFANIMKAGINIIRAHTMPPSPSFAQVADEMGMCVVGESELTFNSNFAFEEPVFWENYERLMRERIARDKNHPSIIIWSTGNEVMCCSPGLKIGQQFHDAYRRFKKIDPTRPYMQEGDGDLRDMVDDAHPRPMDIINLHLYDVSSTKNPLWATEFPNVAWELENVTKNSQMPGTIKSGVELPDKNRPWYIGEFGPNAIYVYPDSYTFWTGPDAYRDLFGKGDGLIRAVGETMTFQMQAYRDQDIAGIAPWDMPESAPFDPYLSRSFEPVTAFSRDLRTHATSGEKVRRSVIVINDSRQKQDLTLITAFRRDRQEFASRTRKFTLLPGTRTAIDWEMQMPEVLFRDNNLQLGVRLTDRQGKQISGFTQDWTLYPRIKPNDAWKKGRAWLAGGTAELGAIAKWTGAPLHHASELALLNAAEVPLLVIDSEAYDELGKNAETILTHYAEQGGTLMALGVNTVLLGDLRLAANSESNATRLFKLRNSELTAGTTDADWQFWQADHYVSRGQFEVQSDPAYEFPLVSGGRNGLTYTPLAVRAQGKGRIIACRLQLNRAVESEPVARHFLNNLVAFAQTMSSDAQASPTMEAVLLCPDAERANWQTRLQKVRIPLSDQAISGLDAKKHIVLLTGDAAPTEAELADITKFVNDGGKLWLHRLTPTTAYLKTAQEWVRQPLEFKTPPMWLQQYEVRHSHGGSFLDVGTIIRLSLTPWLDGINDYHTCWATFGWTNGSMFSVRTSPIADYSLTKVGRRGAALLKEPANIGTWDISENGGSLSQKLLRSLGTHTVNEKPGYGMASFVSGKGFVLIDQLRWDSVMLDDNSESKDKARYFGGTLWKNLIVSNVLTGVSR